MANTCVTIPDDKIDILKRYIGRIEKDFGVKANIQNENTSRDGGDARNSTWVLGLTGKSVSELEAAKKFVSAVTAAGEVECHVGCQDGVFAGLQDVPDDLKKEAQALLVFNKDEHAVSVLTPSDNLEMAQALVNQQHKTSPGTDRHPSCDHTNTACDHHTHNHNPKHSKSASLLVHVKSSCPDEEQHCLGHTPSLSPGGESSHDSCYDSDDSAGSRRSSCAQLDTPLHNDVSRTVSDTLAAEHSDQETGGVKNTLDVCQDVISSCDTTVTSDCFDGLHGQARWLDEGTPDGADANLEETPISKQCLESQNDETHDSEDLNLNDVSFNPDYSAKIEFGIKLGYSEQQIRVALQKLGPDVSQNNLLSELIESDESARFDNQDDGESLMDRQELEASVPTEAGQHRIDIRDSEGRSLLPSQVALQEHSEDSGQHDLRDEDNLRNIVLDGSNIAMSHGNKEVFSCQGIKLAVEFFRERNHKNITVFVPQWRKEASRPDTPITNQKIMYELEKEKILVFTPARWVNGKRVVCYDDRYIIKLAAEEDGIVVSNDNYRDLINESPEFKKVIESRLLMYSFVNDRFMPPDDPYGRHGPSLDNFLMKVPRVPEHPPRPCPYLKKCTYGNKCKFYHPERGSLPQKSVTECLQEQAKVKIQEVRRGSKSREPSPGDIGQRGRSPTPSDFGKKTLTKTKSLALATPGKTPLSRTKSYTPKPLVPCTVGSELPLESTRGGHNKLEMSPQRFCESQGNLQVTVTSAPVDANKIAQHKMYDDKLTKYRKEIILSEEKARKETEKMKSDLGFSFHNGQEGASLKPPTHWSTITHETLRATHSDPQSFHSEPYGGGHLALAKKLSDEGKDPSIRRPSSSHQNLASHSMIDSPQTSPLRRQSPSPANGPPQSLAQGERRGSGGNQHAKLVRQLSLKGPEDPRWQQKQGHNTQVDSRNMPRRVKNMPEDPPFRFLGSVQPHPKPHNNHAWYPQELQSSRGGAGLKYTFGGPVLQPNRNHQQMDHQALGRHSSFNPDHCMPEQIPQGPYVGHTCASRMASAPTYPISRNLNQESSQPRKMPSLGPVIHRQNSTSDPQLHMHQDGPCVDPMSQHMMPFYQQMSRGFSPESAQSKHSWSQAQLFENPTMLGQGRYDDPQIQTGSFEGMVVNRNGSFDGSVLHRGGSFENQMNPPNTFEKEFSLSRGMPAEKSRSFEGHPTSLDVAGYNRQSYGQFIDRPSNSDPKSCLSDQSLYFSSGPHNMEGFPPEISARMLGPRRSSPDVYQVHNHTQCPPDMSFSAQVGGPPIMMAPAPSPPHPDEQGIADLGFTTSDPRSNMFYRLCELFQPARIADVMRRYPAETPEQLCNYLMNKKE